MSRGGADVRELTRGGDGRPKIQEDDAEKRESSGREEERKRKRIKGGGSKEKREKTSHDGKGRLPMRRGSKTSRAEKKWYGFSGA